MPCYKPLKCQQYYSAKTLKIVSDFRSKTPNAELPCGRCLGCRLEHAKEWALRCYHENLIHEEKGQDSMFLTLTYAPEHLPKDHGLHHEHFQKFIRSLRKKTKKKLRYFMSGEYGEPTEKNNFIARPHFHAIIFGYRPADLKLANIRNGSRNYISESLTHHWPYGTHEIGYVSFKNAGYVARYVLKKQQLDKSTGELPHDGKTPPYIRMSNRPGIGKTWFDKYQTDLFPHDYAILPDGRQTTVPTYYRKLLERENPALAETLRAARIEKAKTNPDNSPDRLLVREFIQTKKAERLKREL